MTVASAQPRTAFDAERVRCDFPILSASVHGKPLVYLDNGATTQKPRAVIDRIVRYYEHENANIHRGVYELSQRATAAYEETRAKVARFINAADPREVIFVRGTTEGVNLVAHSYGSAFVRPGDEIVVSGQEHHSDIVPWQMLAERVGNVRLRVIPVNDAGELRLDVYESLLNERTRLIAVTHLSNALGTINDVKRIVALARQRAPGAKVLVDGAQWVAHFPTDVHDLDVDFYTFSGHKLFGPTGIGVLYGRRALLESMPPFMGGGDMIESVTFEKTSYAGLPNRFEAGTPDIAGVVGLGAAIDYVQSIGFERMVPYEEELCAYALGRLGEVPGLRLIGTAKQRASVISFVLDDPPISTLDVGLKLDAEGICVRTGHHCCQPIMDRFGIASTVRASLAMYNTTGDVDRLVEALKRIRAQSATAEGGASQHRPAHAPSADTISFPGPAGASPAAVADELAEVFAFLEDRNAKNEQVLDYARSLPRYFDVLKTLTPRLSGCMSQVHVLTRLTPGTTDRFEFVADADAEIVRGEIAILQKIYSGQRASDVARFDIEGFFNRIGLEHFLTQQRRTGLASMVQRIRSAAAAIEQGGEASHV